MNILGVFHSYSDPSAALIVNNRVVAFAEEERLLRIKHAVGYFPSRSIEFVLKKANMAIDDIDAIVQPWDCNKYDSGEMQKVYDEINSKYPTTEGDIAYQKNHISTLSAGSQKGIILRNLRRFFGDKKFPPIFFINHHLSHACMGYFQSGLDNNCLVLTIDGSGEEVTTAWWIAENSRLKLLREIHIPHSLGWFYSAFTEYLGFRAYDGEYKVMGLAAYGEHDPEIHDKISKIVWYDDKGGFELDPMILMRGQRSYSYYYSDNLVKFLGRSPRSKNEDISKWHINLAFEVQKKLEEIVFDMTRYWIGKTGVKRLAISGGVGLNVKMNGNLFMSGIIDDIFVHPLCADTGTPIGAALAYLYSKGEDLEVEELPNVYYGPSFSDEEIEKILISCKLDFTKEDDICKSAARLIADGKVVGWFQGEMEGGPRALGNRSILADPRDVASRDKVNAVIKFREFWRPFCPSMTEEGAKKYFVKFTKAPFMIVTFHATDFAKEEIPAVVHVDGTVRPQIVEKEASPLYHELITEFEKLTGVPCLLNTSFNIKGEPIVCTPHDAIRTFSATGLDALAVGNFLIQKPKSL